MAFALTKAPSPDEILNEKNTFSRFWQKIFLKSQTMNASDIHVESLKDGLHVRFRINGTLSEETERKYETQEMVQLVDKLKEVAQLDTSSKKSLQDGSFSLNMTDCTYRISLTPGFSFGECAVLRIIRNNEPPQLDDLFLTLQAKTDLTWALRQKQGLILVTGPTGSGKSTTLQACIASLDSESKKIIAIEDPPERILPGVIHEKITHSYSWSHAIKGAMRQDPDIILIGEIRDHESAKLAIEASMTGHLVLSTLHTNDVPSTINRFFTLGIEKYLLVDSFLFISAQRLLKKLCNSCKKPLQNTFKRNKHGCAHCKFTGVTGRIPILEYCVLPDPALIENFNQVQFATCLKQTLGGEQQRIVLEGLVEAHTKLPFSGEDK